MTKYIARPPKSYVADECIFEAKLPASTMIIMSNEDLEDTGLVNMDGVKIYREKNKVGFLTK